METRVKNHLSRYGAKGTVPVAKIVRIARLVGTRYRSRKVLLYGSYAYGKPHADSDIDLLVVTSRVPGRQFRWRASDEWKRKAGVPVQIVFMDSREYDETCDIVGGLAYPATHWGRVLYEKEA